MPRFASIALFLVGCAASPAPTATPATPVQPVVAEPAPPAIPKELSRTELDRRVAAGELAVLRLEAIERHEISVTEERPPARTPDELVTTDAMPGGWSSTVYADRYRRLWVGTSQNEIHAPPGVSISATRVFETRWRVPQTYRLVGKFSIVK